jgi:3-phenylpropionate/cinnamic acid dioxygenase small subunit
MPTTIEHLLAREGIRDLVARYNSYSDTGRFEPLFELFAEHAVMDTTGADGAKTTWDGRQNIKLIFTGAHERIETRTDPNAPAYIRHFTATHQIDLIDDDPDHASGRCYFAVIMANGLDHWGRYIDRYVRIDGTWKFEHRSVTVDGRSETSWFAP